MKKILSICLIIVILLLQVPVVLPAVGLPVSYSWNSVPIGAGGFVTGIAIHPTEPNLVYIRTDVGGAYRWSEENKDWTQLCDAFGRDDSSFYGIDGIALDAHNADAVYMAAGTGASGSDVLKSTNRGGTWAKTKLSTSINSTFPTAKIYSGNGANRGMGERIAVDPANGDIIYTGTIGGGLWRSTNAAQSWQYVALPNFNPSATEASEIRSIVFDTSTSTEGVKTDTIYVGITSCGMYRSTDGGSTWEKLSGAPATPMRMSVAPDTQTLYVASMTGLFKFKDNIFTEISPTVGRGGRFNAVSVDPLNNNNLVCTGPHTNDNYMEIPFWYSSDGGLTWVNKMDTSVRNSTLPWNPNPGFNSNGHCIMMDWNSPGRTWLSDWFCAWRTEDISSGATQTWNFFYKNLEEIVPRNIVSQPSGEYRMLAAVADNRGFPYTDPSQYPTRQINSISKYSGAEFPGIMSISSIDYCVADPNIVVSAGINWNSYGKLQISTDNTHNWRSIATIPCYVNSSGTNVKDNQNSNALIPLGSVAMSSQKTTSGNPAIVMIPAYAPTSTKLLPASLNNKTTPLISTDMGVTWTQATGLDGLNIVTDHWNNYIPLTSDKVIGQNFYIIYNRQIYVSNDWGKSWRATAQITDGWNIHTMKIKAAPGIGGEVWATMGSGLYRSSNSAESFTKIAGISNVVGFGFGKHAPDRTNPTAYLYGTINGTEGIYRSVDMGATWQKINDSKNKFGCSPGIVEGDMQKFGVVYLGSGGRGIFYGEPDGGTAEDTGYDIVPQQYSASMSSNTDLNNWTPYYNASAMSNGYQIRGGMLANDMNNVNMVRNVIYDGIEFGGNYTYSAHLRNDYAGLNNKASMLFNYVDFNNSYSVQLGGTSTSSSTVSLVRKVGGDSVTLGSYTGNLNVRVGADIEVTYHLGEITVKGKVDGVMTTLIEAQDSELFSGKIGVGSESSLAAFSNINVVQTVPDHLPSAPPSPTPTPSEEPSPTPSPTPSGVPVIGTQNATYVGNSTAGWIGNNFTLGTWSNYIFDSWGTDSTYLYSPNSWTGDFNYHIRQYNVYGGTCGYIYFFYQDRNNYYGLSLGTTAQLFKVVNGEKTELGTIDASSINTERAIRIIRSASGNIKVTVGSKGSDATQTTWFDLNDTSLNYGKIGLGTSKSGGYYSGITVSGSIIVDQELYSENFNIITDTEKAKWLNKGDNLVSIANGKIGGSDWSGSSMMVYTGQSFSGTYKYGVDLGQNWGSSPTNIGSIAFNYNGDRKFYSVDIGGGTGGTVTLRKFNGNLYNGVETLATYNNSLAVMNKSARIEVMYEQGGYISVDLIVDGITTRVFDKVQDTSYTEGYIGVLKQSSAFTFDNAKVTTAQAFEITGVEVTAPNKNTYIQGEDLDLTGMIVALLHKYSTISVAKEGYTVTGYQKNTVGIQTITVTYGNFTDTFEIEVVAAETSTSITQNTLANANNSISGNITVAVNNVQNDQPAIISIGVYKGSQLVGIYIKNVSLLAGNNSVEINNINISNVTSDTYTAKVLVLSSSDTLIPVTNSAELQIN